MLRLLCATQVSEHEKRGPSQGPGLRNKRKRGRLFWWGEGLRAAPPTTPLPSPTVQMAPCPISSPQFPPALGGGAPKNCQRTPLPTGIVLFHFLELVFLCLFVCFA